MFYLRQLQLCGPSSINSLISPAGLQRWENDGWSLEIRGRCFHSFRASNLKGTSTPLLPSGRSSPSHHITSIRLYGRLTCSKICKLDRSLSRCSCRELLSLHRHRLWVLPTLLADPALLLTMLVSVVLLCFLNNPNMCGQHLNRLLLLVMAKDGL